MKPEKPIWYEPHPLPPGRKQELVSQGFRIIDAKFKPEGYVNPGEEPVGDVAPKKEGGKRGRKPKAADPQSPAEQGEQSEQAEQSGGAE